MPEILDNHQEAWLTFNQTLLSRIFGMKTIAQFGDSTIQRFQKINKIDLNMWKKWYQKNRSLLVLLPCHIPCYCEGTYSLRAFASLEMPNSPTFGFYAKCNTLSFWTLYTRFWVLGSNSHVRRCVVHSTFVIVYFDWGLWFL